MVTRILLVALLVAGTACGSDDPATQRKVKVALAIAEAGATSKRATAVAVAPAPRPATPKDYPTAHAKSIEDAKPLVVFVGCDAHAIPGAVVSKTEGDSLGSTRGPAIVVGFPQGDRLYVDSVLKYPASDEKLADAVKAAGKKIDQRPKQQMPTAPKPLDWQIRHDPPCLCGDGCKCPSGKCPGTCPVTVSQPVVDRRGTSEAPASRSQVQPVLVGYTRVCNGNGTCSLVPVYR